MQECTIIVGTVILFVVHRDFYVVLSNENRTAITTYNSVAHFLTFQLLYTISGTNCVKKKTVFYMGRPRSWCKWHCGGFCVKKGKAIPYRPWGFQEVEAPRFSDNWHRPHLPPRKYCCYSFLLEAELTAGPEISWRDYVNEKFQWHHRELIPRPSSL
jgi:hypothetical protein